MWFHSTDFFFKFKCVLVKTAVFRGKELVLKYFSCLKINKGEKRLWNSLSVTFLYFCHLDFKYQDFFFPIETASYIKIILMQL